MQLGYAPFAGWSQASGGDVIACMDISSELYPATNPRQFVTDGAGGFPGVVSYRGSYDFDSGVNTGATYVSSKNWLVPEAPPPICTENWYQHFMNRFDMNVQPADYSPAPNPLPKPATRLDSDNQPIPYKVSGNATISGWNVGTADTLVIFVTGNLTIDGDITITGNGFVAFVVGGNITVTSNVGNPAGNNTPNLHGIFITSGTFGTSRTTQVAHARLVTQGTVVANSVQLDRDLTLVGGTNDVPAEQFIYDPNLLMRLPQEFKDVKIRWSEVAP